MQRYFGIPAGTIRAWASDTRRHIEADVATRGVRAAIEEPNKPPRPLTRALVRNGQTLYRVTDVLDVLKLHGTRQKRGETTGVEVDAGWPRSVT